jgi:hypothetical protein
MPSSSAASLTVDVTFCGAMLNERVAASYFCSCAEILAGRQAECSKSKQSLFFTVFIQTSEMEQKKRI